MSTLTTATDLPLTAGRWTIDIPHSTVNFSVRHLGLAKVRGRFTKFSGGVTVGDTVETTEVDAEIGLASVDTSNPDRDAHLRSGDFFSTEDNPVMTFASTGVRVDDDGYVLDGELTIAGVTRPVSLDVEFLGVEDYPMDDSTRAGFVASATIKRSEFGIDFDIPLGGDKVAIGDKVTVELDIQLIAP